MWRSSNHMGDNWSIVMAPSQARPLLGTVSIQGSGEDACSFNCVIMEPKGQLRIPVIEITQEVSMLLMHLGKSIGNMGFDSSISYLCQ